MGAYITTSVRWVNKWLGFYERQGLICRGNGTVSVVQPKQLQKYAS